MENNIEDKNSNKSPLLNNSGIEKLYELLMDNLEVIGDGISESKIVEDIPVLGSLYKSYKVLANLNEQLHYKKMVVFLTETKDVPQEKIDRFLEELNREGKSKDLAENILLWISRMDHTLKAKALGGLLRAKMMGYMDLVTFYRLATILDKVFYYDLESLPSYFIMNYSQKRVSEFLHTLGLIEWVDYKDFYPESGQERPFIDPLRNPFPPNHKVYRLTEWGRLMNKYGLGNFEPEYYGKAINK